MANIKINYKIETRQVELIKKEISDYIFKSIKDNRYKKASDADDHLLKLTSVSVRLSYTPAILLKEGEVNKIKYISISDGVIELNNTNKVYKLITKVIERRGIDYKSINSVHIHLFYIPAIAITD